MQTATQFELTPLSERQIFLSYSSAHKEQARQLVQSLRRNGLKVWFDEDNLAPGDRWMTNLEQAIEQASAMVVYVGRLGVHKWVDREVRFGLERNTREPSFRLIPVLGEGADLALLPPFLSQHQAVDLRDPGRMPEQIRRLVETLGNRQTQRAVPDSYWEAHSPFRSLQVFEPEDSWLFFGRDTEADCLLARLAREPVVAVLGNSGCGKSSLIRAGLIPALQRGRFRKDGVPIDSWQIAVFRPSQSPFDYLAEALPSQLLPELSRNQQMEFIADLRNKLPSTEDALRNAISALARTQAIKDKDRILLVADQFEEIFTLTRDRKVREQYINSLLAASRPGGAVAVHLVLALRADFYSHCLDHPQLSRQLQANLYNVPRMDATHLRDNIEKRLALAAAHAELGLIDSLLADVGSEPGDLALLEHALEQLWEKRGPSNQLTNTAYGEIGRLRGALGRHADQVYSEIGGQAEQRMVQRIFFNLVQLGEGAQDTRRRVSKQELLQLGSPQQIEPLLDRLASNRLISTSGQGETSFVEVSHEALIREWPRFRQWLNENRDDLRLQRRLSDAAKEWDDLNRDRRALLQGPRLDQAQEWIVKHPDAPALLQEFLDASLSAEEEAKRKEDEVKQYELAGQQELRREAEARAEAETTLRLREHSAAVRFRWFSVALGFLLLIAAAIAWYARRQQSIAHQQQLLAESRALAAQAEELLPRDPGAALNQAVHSWQIAKTHEANTAISRIWPQTSFALRHDGPVSQARFSPDGLRIVTASDDHTARVWSATNGQLLATLKHKDIVQEAAFSPDGTRILTASSDRTARLWNAIDGQLLTTLRHKDIVQGAAFSPDGTRILTASSDHTARLWNTSNGQLLAALSHESISSQRDENAISEAEFSPNGDRIVTTSSGDDTARVWNAVSGELVVTLRNGDWVVRAAFSPNGQHIVTSSEKMARVWDATSGQLLTALRHEDTVWQAAFSPDGQRVVTACNDGSARVWNAESGQLLAILRHEDAVWHAAFSPDGQYIVTTSDDHTARLWNATNGQLLATLAHNDKVAEAAFSPDGQHVVTASDDHTAQVWNAVGVQLLATLKVEDEPKGIGFSASGVRVVTQGRDNAAVGRVWNVDTGQLLATLKHEDTIEAAAFSPDAQRVMTSSNDGTARMWNAETGQLLITFKHDDQVYHAVFSRDDHRVVTTSADHTARVWNADTGKLLAILRHEDTVWRAMFSHDGQRVVTASWDKTARVWNADTGKLLAILRHGDWVDEATFSPDDQLVVTITSNDHTARVWKAADGQLLASLKHDDNVVQATFSPDSQRIVTASVDHTARVWNAANGQLLALLKHDDRVLQAVFSPDGQCIVTASVDQTARVWSAASGQLLATLKHQSIVSEVTFSPDGQRIVTLSYDHAARVWQMITLSDIQKILGR